MIKTPLLSLMLFLSCLTSAQYSWVNGVTGLPLSHTVVALDAFHPGNRPGNVSMSATTVDSAGNLWSYGGLIVGADYTFWKYDITINQWKVFGRFKNVGEHCVGLGVEDSANTPGASRNGVLWFDTHGYIWLHDEENLWTWEGNRIWRFNPANGMWAKMKSIPALPINNLPVYAPLGVPSASAHPGKTRHQINRWSDTNGNLWLYGGSFSSYFAGDLWKFDISTLQWSWEGGEQVGLPCIKNYATKGVFSDDAYPGGMSAGFCWTDSLNRLWLFGDSSPDPGNQTWCYDISSGKWAWFGGDQAIDMVTTFGHYGPACTYDPLNLPAERFGAECINPWYSQNKIGFWMYGGRSGVDGYSFYRDLWFYRWTDNQWILAEGDDMNPAPSCSQTLGRPCGRWGTVTWEHQNKVYLFGGYDQSDVWTYDPDPSCILAAPEIISSVPNVFSPNGDGINDHFLVKGDRSLVVRIYNRWGQEVFQSNLNASWDGSDCSDGTYFYVISGTDEEKTPVPRKGFIMLLR
jgi:gliding motility-associated-like protein